MFKLGQFECHEIEKCSQNWDYRRVETRRVGPEKLTTTTTTIDQISITIGHNCTCTRFIFKALLLLLLLLFFVLFWGFSLFVTSMKKELQP